MIDDIVTQIAVMKEKRDPIKQNTTTGQKTATSKTIGVLLARSNRMVEFHPVTCPIKEWQKTIPSTAKPRPKSNPVSRFPIEQNRFATRRSGWFK